MTALGRKQTFMVKILVWAQNLQNKFKFFKKSLLSGFPVLKIKSHFSPFFSIESSNPKNIFCIIKPCLLISLSSRKSWGIYLQRKNQFLSFLSVISMYDTQTLFQDICPDLALFFCMFSIVHSSKYWKHFFEIDFFLN